MKCMLHLLHGFRAKLESTVSLTKCPKAGGATFWSTQANDGGDAWEL